MAAVITDIRRPRSRAGQPRHLAPVPDTPGWASLPPQSLPVAPAHYGRRRLAAVVLMVGLALMAGAGLRAVAGAPGVFGTPGTAVSAVPVTVEVAPGDTFWSIASQLQRHGDPRPLVDRLVASHGGGVLRAGERLSVRR